MNPLIVTVSVPEMNFMCRVGPADASAPGPDPSIPELAILNHYAGVWEDEIVGPAGLKRTELGEWVLDGTFLRQSWTTDDNDGAARASGITMMTFDVTKKHYLSWSFLAIGSVVQNKGRWDPESNTMIWIDRLDDKGEKVITRARFIDGVTNSWSIVESDGHGHIVREVSGKSVRKRL